MPKEKQRQAASRQATSVNSTAQRDSTAATHIDPAVLARAQSARQSRVAHSFSQIVAVLMRDPAFRDLTLADLETLVLPPLMAGQFRLAHATTQNGAELEPQAGISVPVALALWARVSPAVDRALSTRLEERVQLRATDWVSGDIPWLITVAGHARAVPEFLAQLAAREFQEVPAKMRVHGADGKLSVKALVAPSA